MISTTVKILSFPIIPPLYDIIAQLHVVSLVKVVMFAMFLKVHESKVLVPIHFSMFMSVIVVFVTVVLTMHTQLDMVKM
jgi:hypothetical protein